VDVAPTLLRWLGAAPATALDGRVLEELFSGDGPPDARDAVVIGGGPAAEAPPSPPDGDPAGSDASALEDRLRSLGYIE
jgi:hypothetical protein